MSDGMMDPQTVGGRPASEVEPAEPDVLDVEPEPVAETALAQVESDLATLKAQVQAQLQKSQAMIEFQAAVRQQVIASARPNHWPRFGNRVRPDISECMRLRMLLGVTIRIDAPQRHDYEDEGGQYYVYATIGEATLGPITVPCYGSASSRTKFFFRSGGEYVDPRDINPSFIAKMAWSECFKHGVRLLFGLDVDPDELEGISGVEPQDKAQGWAGKGKGKGKPDSAGAKKLRVEIGNTILSLAGGDEDLAKDFLEYLTTFTGRDGKVVAGKRSLRDLTDKQISNLDRWRNKNLTPEAFATFEAARAAAEADDAP